MAMPFLQVSQHTNVKIILTPLDVRGWIGGGKRVGLPLPVVKAPGLTAEDPFCFQPSPSCSWSDLLTNMESSAQPESSFIKLVDGIMRTQETTMKFMRHAQIEIVYTHK